MELIRLENITKTYGKDDAKTYALNEINLTIDKGEMLAIMGPSGSGKSTLLNIIGCLDKANKGHYYINGNNILTLNNRKLAKLRNKTFGFVVQYFALLNDYTVYQNIEIPLEYSKIKKRTRKDRILNILKMLSIENKINKHPNQLSGGQNQRVAIARAIINNPDIILADEPTGALDKSTGDDVMELFRQLNNQGKTIIIVTHDENVSQKCNRVIKIQDGKIIE